MLQKCLSFAGINSKISVSKQLELAWTQKKHILIAGSVTAGWKTAVWICPPVLLKFFITQSDDESTWGFIQIGYSFRGVYWSIQLIYAVSKTKCKQTFPNNLNSYCFTTFKNFCCCWNVFKVCNNLHTLCSFLNNWYHFFHFNKCPYTNVTKLDTNFQRNWTKDLIKLLISPVIAQDVGFQFLSKSCLIDQLINTAINHLIN